MTKALRGAVFTLTADPFLNPIESCFRYLPDGLVFITDGKIAAVREYSPELAREAEITHYQHSIICPGFIDAHVHYPQLEIIGAYAGDLLEWLDKFAFPAELRFADQEHAARIARRFMQEALRAGSTSGAVFCTVHPASAEAFFAESARWNTRMIAGKLLMDRAAPDGLKDSPESAYDDSARLIEKWHGQGRQLYAVTPRFAISSTPEQLAVAGRLCRDYPEVYLHTHLNESLEEIARVQELFPGRRYLDVYAEHGLLGSKSLFAHGIHMSEQDYADCHQAGAALLHCPSSNLFIGSGFFRVFEAKRADRPLKTGLATDVGGGTSMSMLQSMGEAYKVAQAKHTRLHPVQLWHLATRGGAEALGLADKIGSLEAGLEADLIVLDLQASPLLNFRLERSRGLEETLFVLMTLGDERAIRATYVSGACVYDKERAEPFKYPE